ncbi:hypothetical protein BZG36_00404 [Bifiguratus adelaidae]|uniref:NADP-dependent oxidoreductase domain-containing protein n=1 Tax=Bifiguratus adelaidae TaxID=1938954 RepID=A0A261Y833_9FUNG|nr:hypothetical protein BZG36_00404 [Bifiguratus adelaidae]
MQQVTLGQSGKKVPAIGFGLMGLTWRPKTVSREEAIQVMRYAYEQGALFFNGGEFYGVPPNVNANLDLINAFFEQYPDAKDNVFLSIKGGLGPGLVPDGSPENVRRCVNNVLEHLKGSGKKLDLFECARVDKNVPIEVTIGELAKCVQEGLIGHIGLSEVSANSIRKAHAVHPISAVEVEFSLWSRDILFNGVYDTCRELGIPIVAYSPLGRGVLTGQIRSAESLPEGDMRHHFDRFKEENLRHNLQLVEKLGAIAKTKGCTLPQLALTWVLSHEGVMVIPGATKVERIQENMQAASVHLSSQELAEIKSLLDAFEVKGGRYNAHAEAHLDG